MTKARSNATAEAAKGDLRVGTGTNLSGILGVGNSGEQIVADSSTSTGLRYTAGNPISNPVINSAFQVWQRGTSAAVTAGAYIPDRWYFYRGVAGSTVSRQSTNDTTNLPFIQYCARVQRDSGNTSTSVIQCGNSFETINSIPYSGKTVTFSFYARAGANYSAASNALTYRLTYGTGTDQNIVNGYTGGVAAINADATLTTTWQRFTATAAIPSSSTEMGVAFLFTPVGTAGANDYYEVTGVQIDIGSVALPFRTNGATLQGELAACQRYYYRFGGDQTTQPYGIGYGTSATTALITVYHPVPMRTAPSLTDYALLWVVDHATTTAVTSMGVPGNWSGKNCTAINAVVASGLTTNRPYNLIAQGTLSSYLGFSAEL